MEMYVDKHELAKALNVVPSTIDYLRRKGKLPVYMVGKHPRFSMSEVLKAIKVNARG